MQERIDVVPASRRTLPPALLARVELEVAAKRSRLEQSGRADIDTIRRRQALIAEAFFDVGEALVRLRDRDVLVALGYRSLRDMLAGEQLMGMTAALELVQVAQRVAREDALRWGKKRTTALIGLAMAVGNGDRPVDIEKKQIDLPDGTPFDVAASSANSIANAARAFRMTRAAARGRTTQPRERKTCAELQRRLRTLGAERVEVEAIAGLPGRGADVRIRRLGLDELSLLRKTLADL